MRKIDVMAVFFEFHVLAMIRRGFVVEPLVIRADLDPAFAGHREVAHKCRLVFRHLDAQPEAARLRLILHVPDLRPGVHQRMDAVACIARCAAGINNVHPMEIPLHL